MSYVQGQYNWSSAAAYMNSFQLRSSTRRMYAATVNSKSEMYTEEIKRKKKRGFIALHRPICLYVDEYGEMIGRPSGVQCLFAFHINSKGERNELFLGRKLQLQLRQDAQSNADALL